MLLIKLAMAVLLVFCCFGFHRFPLFVKTVLTFFGVNFIYAGVMFAVWILICPKGMFYNNGVVYFNISALTLAVSTIVTYGIVKLVCYVLARKVHPKQLYPVTIQKGERQVELMALYDSGNHLGDPFTGKPVMIVQFDAIKDLIPLQLHRCFLNPINAENLPAESAKSFQIKWIPYHTVDGNDFLAAFSPDRCTVHKGQTELLQEVLVGVSRQQLSQGEFQAILHKDMI